MPRIIDRLLASWGRTDASTAAKLSYCRAAVPPPSLARYLAEKVAPPALVVNVAINFFVGRAVYPAGIAVPLLGDKSAGADTLLGAFLIGFFRMLVVRPAGRLEARAGRVRGFARPGALAAWPRRRPVLAAIAFGLACMALLGAPAVLALLRLRGAPLSRDAFLLFKTAFA